MANAHKLTDDELLKLKAVVLYIVNKCVEIDYLHIFKILYFADREHFAKYGRRITDDTYCALPKGPVPSFLFDALKNSNSHKGREHKIISDSLYNPDPTYYYIFSAKEKADMDELSISDIECLDNSIKENKDVDANTLSSKSHDSAWLEAWNQKQSSPINNISIAKAGGANNAMLEYINENEYIDAIIG